MTTLLNLNNIFPASRRSVKTFTQTLNDELTNTPKMYCQKLLIPLPLGRSSVNYSNAVKTSSKKVTQRVNETREKLSYRVIISSSERQETNLITPFVSTSVLCPSGEAGTNTGIPFSLTQISLLSLIALSFILVCILLACMICQKRK